MLYQGKVTKVSRLNNSRWGNPAYAVWLEGLGRFRTPTDAGWVYGKAWHVLEGLTVLIDTGKTNKTIHEITAEGVQ